MILNQSTKLKISLSFFIIFFLSSFIVSHYVDKNKTIEKNIIDEIISTEEKKSIGVFKVKNNNHNGKGFGYVVFKNKEFGEITLFSDDPHCIYKFKENQSYEIYGYRYTLENEVKPYIEDLCKDITEPFQPEINVFNK